MERVINLNTNQPKQTLYRDFPIIKGMRKQKVKVKIINIFHVGNKSCLEDYCLTSQGLLSDTKQLSPGCLTPMIDSFSGMSFNSAILF